MDPSDITDRAARRMLSPGERAVVREWEVYLFSGGPKPPDGPLVRLMAPDLRTADDVVAGSPAEEQSVFKEKMRLARMWALRTLGLLPPTRSKQDRMMWKMLKRKMRRSP